MGHFSKTDIVQYNRDGFIVIKGLYSASEMAHISKWIDEIAAQTDQVGKQMAYFEDSLLEKGKKVLSRIEKFADYHPGLHDLIYADKMLGRASELLGEKALLFKEKVNFKLPGGGGFAPHQDIQPGWDDYAPFFISVLITVDESTVENGCLELSAGHHKKGWIGERMKPLTEKQLEGIQFKKYPMSPGDVAFFDCFVPHQSEPNLTSGRRRNLYLTFNRTSDGDHRQKYYADKRKSFPPDNEHEPGKIYTFKV